MTDIYKQEAPFAIQIELTLFCNLRCPFCAISTIQPEQGKGMKFMEKSTIISLAEQIKELNWNPRIEIAMRGEPTLHPDYIGMIEALYRILPRHNLMMTTNGGGILRSPGTVQNIRDLFVRGGLNILALDDYEGVKIIDKIRPHLPELCEELQISLYNYPAEPDGNPHRRSKYPFISVIEDISVANKGTHSSLSNHAGSAGPLDFSMNGQRCHRPFRELSVHYNGDVPICCNDWTSEYICGNIVKDGLLNVWHSKEFDAARRYLIQGRREHRPCYGCNQRSYRVGLLPDKKGQDEMLPPDDESAEIIRQTLSRGPLLNSTLKPHEQ